ncbi:MAG TPA: hypothetical protein VEH06_14585 [Candidatus Bathyarchaeia archaeon]|nr:hypothetical protein [Candidatus Bathyarchaeia archaeon]
MQQYDKSYLHRLELAKELKSFPSMYKDNGFESIIELYESGCADYIFNFVVANNNTREEKLVTPILMNLDAKKFLQFISMGMKK